MDRPGPDHLLVASLLLRRADWSSPLLLLLAIYILRGVALYLFGAMAVR